jgi:signal transduction histidine kinase
MMRWRPKRSCWGSCTTRPTGCGPAAREYRWPRVKPGASPTGWWVCCGSARERPVRIPVQQVFSAIHVWREAGCTGRRVAGVDLSDVSRARKRWQETRSWDPAQPHFLQALVERLQRGELLRQQFDQAVEQEKLAALGELAYGASHEINNPLANISTRAQAMLLQESDPEKRRMLAIIHTQALRANEMIADMMLFARPPEPVRRQVDLVAIVDGVLAELREEAELQGTLLTRLGGAEPLMLSADATLLAMAVRAICVNALEALGVEGRVEVEVERAAANGELGDWGCLVIRDTGPGIPAHVRRHLFDPFFSGREAGRGLGLGLAKAWRVVTLHGGRIDVASGPASGTRFTIRLPLPAVEPGAAPQQCAETEKET